jgi:LysW-gamma-L-lysine carboxypeptidase
MDNHALLRRMVEIRSHSGEEGNLARFLCEEMQTRGFETHIDAAGNAVGTRGNGQSGPTIILLGHMDTVPGNVPVRVEGDLLYGRGAVDAKGPLAAFVAAASTFEGPGRVMVIGAVEEEAATSKGAKYVADHYRPDIAFIGEPSAWDRVTVGYKGRLLVEYQLSQNVAHTAGQKPGVCEHAVAFWHDVQEAMGEVNADRPLAPFDRLLCSLRAMHSNSDGLRDSATMTLGFRLPLNFDVDWWRARLVALAGVGSLSFRAFEPAVRVEKNTAPARAMLAAIRAEGGDPRFVVKTGTSDLNVVAAQWRCPMLAYGPGDASLDHTPDEHISLAEFDRAVRVLQTALYELSRSNAENRNQLVEMR